MTAPVHCPGCNAPAYPTDTHCTRCGFRFLVPRFCTRCASPLAQGSAFCARCGAQHAPRDLRWHPFVLLLVIVGLIGFGIFAMYELGML